MDWTAIANVVTGLGAGMGQPGQANPNANLNQMFQAQAQAKALKEQQEAEDKARKGKIFGSVGGMLGGLALAPLTGGMSIPAAAAVTGAGQAAGGALGSMAGGGQPTLQDTLMNAMGGIVNNAAGGAVSNALTGGGNAANQYITANTVNPRGALGQSVNMDANADAMLGRMPMAMPSGKDLRNDPALASLYLNQGGQISQQQFYDMPRGARQQIRQGGYNNVPTKMQGFGARFGDAIGRGVTTGMNNVAAKYRIVRTADGQEVVIEDTQQPALGY